jgi:hypothetical protein
MSKPNTVEEIVTRFEVQETGCWRWTGYTHIRGYGIVSLRGKLQKAHRLFYEYFVGSIPDGMVICHHCDRPCCVNPAHLFCGTQRDNIMDCIAKGRARRGCEQRGARNNQAKLTDEHVRKIRYEETGSQREIAERYGVTQTVIGDVLRRKSWRHV